jgi:ribose 5-phosphate isomerase B
MSESIAIAADHGGFVLKENLFNWLKDQGYRVEDLGAKVYDAQDDYPNIAIKLAEIVGSKIIERGILICGSGVGASIVANKIRGARACLCHETYSAHQGVEHDDMNILCLGGRVVGIELAKELVLSFLHARFIAEGKYKRRVDRIIEIES